MLPLGTTRKDHEVRLCFTSIDVYCLNYLQDYEEVVIPPAKPVPPRETERLIPVSELDPLAKGSFPGYTSLNRIQSIVYPTAYGTNENMLICGMSVHTLLYLLFLFSMRC